MAHTIPCPRGCGETFTAQPHKHAETLHECPNSTLKKRYADKSRVLIAVYVGTQHTGEEVKD